MTNRAQMRGMWLVTAGASLALITCAGPPEDLEEPADPSEIENPRQGLTDLSAEDETLFAAASRKASLTWFTSYPDPGSEECVKYNGCKWAGQFAAIGKKSESWVRSHNIAAVHSRDYQKYKLKTLRLKKGSKTLDVVVYDMCSDSDCNGCCTRNAKSTGFLIDIEENTANRFGSRSGTVDWFCVNC
jgi:hypothetical protein